MKMRGSDIVVRALEDAGARFTFGIPGTHNIELYDALARSTRVLPILVTDEQSASFMADAVWRASGKLGCVSVVPGAGLTHALSGIAEAFLDTVPLLVLGCGVRTDTGKRFQLHDVDQLAMARPVTKAQLRVERGADVYTTVRRACRLARSGRPGPVLIEVPANLYLARHDVQLDAEETAGPPAAPDAADVARAATLLAAARRPLLYVGLGAAGAAAQLVTLAERLEAPVATTIQGKGVFPEHHPLSLWPGFGDAAPPFVREIARGCDATLAIGCRFGEVATASYGLTPPAPVIHVDIDPQVPGANYATELGIVADGAAFVSALLARLEPRAVDLELRRVIRAGHADVRSTWERSAGPGVTPYGLLQALQTHFGRDTIFTSDSGNGTFWAMEALLLDAPGKLLAPVDYSCMGYAVPAAIGARLACPATPVVCLAGDGAFLMTGLELLTARQLGLAVAVFVLRDGELAQIAQFQEIALNRKTCSILPDYDLAALCRGLGIECLGVRDDAELPGALDGVERALTAGRPAVVDVAIDYSTRTYFTRGVVKTNLGRLPWLDRLRFVARALGRRVRKTS